MVDRWIRSVRKNDGSYQKFNEKKLASSINLALLQAGIHDRSLAARLAHETADHMIDKGQTDIVDTSMIREAALYVIKRDGLEAVANAYEMTSLHLIKSGLVKHVEKRVGGKQPLHPHKIFISVRKACIDCGIEGSEMAEMITKEVVKEINKSHKGKKITVQEIKDVTATKLEEKGFQAVAKSYRKNRYM